MPLLHDGRDAARDGRARGDLQGLVMIIITIFIIIISCSSSSSTCRFMNMCMLMFSIATTTMISSTIVNCYELLLAIHYVLCRTSNNTCYYTTISISASE